MAAVVVRSDGRDSGDVSGRANPSANVQLSVELLQRLGMLVGLRLVALRHAAY